MLISGSPGLLGILDQDDSCGSMPFQACFWKNCWPVIPSGQRTSASGRPTISGAMIRPDLGVIVGEAFLGDAPSGQ